jgi:hypothetical protein
VNKITKIDGTLKDYYERKGYEEPKKKLTFEEWYKVTYPWESSPVSKELMLRWWNIAQENK